MHTVGDDDVLPIAGFTMKAKLLSRTLAATAAFLAIGLSPAAFAASVPCDTGPVPTNVMSCATGLSANLSLLNLVGVSVGPVANAFGTAPGPYNITTTLASANVGGNFALLGNLAVSTGIITDTASSTYNGSISTLFSSGMSMVNNLNLALNLLGLSVLDVTAGTLSSTSTASNMTGFNKTISGTSSITNLVVSAAGQTFTGNITAATPANYHILTALGLDVIANYQSPIYVNGTDQIGIQTAALAIEFNNYGITSGLLHNVLNGTIYVADSAVSVPEPGTWMMMLFGFGLVGVIARQRRTLAPA